MRTELRLRETLVATLVCLGVLEARAQAVEVDISKVKWSSMSSKDTAAHFAILHVDSVSRATHMLYSLPPNTTSPCHWHSGSESNFIVQGSAGMRHAGMVERAASGGFSFVPKRIGHQISNDSTMTLVFSSLDARFDFHPVEDAQCR